MKISHQEKNGMISREQFKADSSPNYPSMRMMEPELLGLLAKLQSFGNSFTKLLSWQTQHRNLKYF
jgi:hypothetical protein